LLSLLIYGHATGVFSSRKIERATHDSIAFRYLAANTHPDHHTIASFHRRFLPQFEAPGDDPIRADTVCAAQANGVTGIRHNQKSDEIEAVRNGHRKLDSRISASSGHAACLAAS
jgi:Transposase domain (DUF772)